jgi:hypothetical protein
MKIYLNIAKKNDKPISDVVEDFFKTNKRIAHGYILNRIKVWWKLSMGHTIHSYTKSIYIHKQILYIQITSAPLRQELSMSTAKILEKLQKELGVEYIIKVVIK